MCFLFGETRDGLRSRVPKRGFLVQLGATAVTLLCRVFLPSRGRSLEIFPRPSLLRLFTMRDLLGRSNALGFQRDCGFLRRVKPGRGVPPMASLPSPPPPAAHHHSDTILGQSARLCTPSHLRHACGVGLSKNSNNREPKDNSGCRSLGRPWSPASLAILHDSNNSTGYVCTQGHHLTPLRAAASRDTRAK